MVTFAVALIIGAVVATLGLIIAPREYRPGVERVLRASMAAAMPGVLLGLVLVEDLWFDTHAASLATSVVGSTLAVLGAAFLPKDTSLKLEAEDTQREAAQNTEPGLGACLTWLWRLRAMRRVPAPGRS